MTSRRGCGSGGQRDGPSSPWRGGSRRPLAQRFSDAFPHGMDDEYSTMDKDDSFFFVPSFELESGLVIRNARVAFRTWGTLSAGADNAVFVSHALTGNAAADAWWS